MYDTTHDQNSTSPSRSFEASMPPGRGCGVQLLRPRAVDYSQLRNPSSIILCLAAESHSLQISRGRVRRRTHAARYIYTGNCRSPPPPMRRFAGFKAARGEYSRASATNRSSRPRAERRRRRRHLLLAPDGDTASTFRERVCGDRATRKGDAVKELLKGRRR